MSTKKAALRDKINKKTKTKSTNKSSNNKQVKKTNKIQKNVIKKQKKAIEIKDVKDEIISNLPDEKIKNKSESKKIESQKKIKNVSKEKTKKNDERVETQKVIKKIQKKDKVKVKAFKARLKKLLQFLKKKKYYILSFLITIILIIVLLFILQKSDEKIFFTFKEYKLGTKVTLSDNSIWYVVEDSSSEKSKVTLLSEKVLDINKDKKINDKDKVVYDNDNKCIYDTKKEKNIGYFLENDVKSLLKEIKGISEIRLLTSEEYINIRKTMDFGYDWKEGNWLANDSLNVWWLETSKYNKIYTVTKRGSYKLSEAKSKNFVRPVIKVDKSSIK